MALRCYAVQRQNWNCFRQISFVINSNFRWIVTFLVDRMLPLDGSALLCSPTAKLKLELIGWGSETLQIGNGNGGEKLKLWSPMSWQMKKVGGAKRVEGVGVGIINMETEEVVNADIDDVSGRIPRRWSDLVAAGTSHVPRRHVTLSFAPRCHPIGSFRNSNKSRHRNTLTSSKRYL